MLKGIVWSDFIQLSSIKGDFVGSQLSNVSRKIYIMKLCNLLGTCSFVVYIVAAK
jgi:hypothetical protein